MAIFSNAPRLIDFTWGDESHPKITLVGKGVCFDSGGLDIKTGSEGLSLARFHEIATRVLAIYGDTTRIVISEIRPTP